MRLHGKRIHVKTIRGGNIFKSSKDNSEKVQKLTELMNNAYVSAGSGVNKKKYTGKTFMI